MAVNFDLRLKGFVGGWDFDSDYVHYILDKYADRNVSVMIDSLGGKTDTALSISAAFSQHGNVSVHYVGMNASAATIAAMGAKHISIDKHAMFLVHKCSYEFFDWGMKNADEFQQLIEEVSKSKKDLEKIDCTIASLYASRCKRKPEDLLALMKEGAWLSADEAKEWGFVDEITAYAEDKAPAISEPVALAMKADGIPMPKGFSMPTRNDESIVDRIVAKISDFFKSKNIPDMEKQEDKKPEDKVAPKEKTDQEEAPKAQHDTAQDDKDAEIARLKAEIEDLKKKPGDGSSKVVDQKKSDQTQQSEVQAFMQTSKSAAELFNSLP